MKADPAPRFQWHKAARLFDGQGREQCPLRQVLPVITDRPSTRALALAMSAAGQGFRIGGDGPAPAPGPVPMLETLTGGSTGTPRRIRRTQRSWIASFAVNADLFGIGPGSRVAILGRLVHSLALYGAVEGLHLGADVHLLDDLRPDRQVRELVSRAISHLYATPTQLRLLEATPGTWPALRQVIVGGAKLDAGLRATVAQLAPNADVVEFYGAAETSFITLATSDTPPGSVGTAYPGVRIEIRKGEIWVQSRYVFEGYASDAGSARWDNGWLSVGEIGHCDEGALFLSGRTGRMVTIADQNVFPEEIERFLIAQPGVTHAAVLSRPDGLRGSVLTAVLSGDPASQPAIATACRSVLGPLKSPRTYVWRQDWPLLPSGKTDLAALAGALP